MPVAAALVVGSTLVGGYAANKASTQAAESKKQGMNQSIDITNRARDDVMKLFQQSSQQSALARDQALNFYQQNAAKRITPYQSGNMAAQQVIGQGATQANNAILGLPVDMGFVSQPQQIQADYGGIGAAQLPASGMQSQGGGLQMPSGEAQNKQVNQGLAGVNPRISIGGKSIIR